MLTRSFFLAAAVLSVTALVGCAAETEANETEEATADLSAAGKALIGVYTSNFGDFHQLVLTDKTVGQANEFTAEVSTGIKCVTVPCPSSERIQGTFTAGTRTITLRSATASSRVQHLLGKFDYAVRGAQLSLSRKDFSQSLDKVVDACSGLDLDACNANKACDPTFGPSACSPDGSICTADMAFKGCKAKDPCAGLELDACSTNEACQPVFGPSHCSPDGTKCTKDIHFKSCAPAEAPTCMSSASCRSGEHCSTDDGVCNSVGLLTVCAGTCVK